MHRTLAALSLAFALALSLSAATSAQPAPGGSYLQSCTNIVVRGRILTATCSSPSGANVRSSIDVSQCRGGSIQNLNGNLACDNSNGAYRGGGYVGAPNARLPAGSYLQSCTNVYVSGRTVTATCSATSGARVTSSLDPNRCRPGTDIANVNGRLECLSYR